MRSERIDDEWNDDPSDEDEGPDGDDDFDYEEFVENEFGGGHTRTAYSPLIKITALVLLFLFVVLAFFQLGI